MLEEIPTVQAALSAQDASHQRASPPNRAIGQVASVRRHASRGHGRGEQCGHGLGERDRAVRGDERGQRDRGQHRGPDVAAAAAPPARAVGGGPSRGTPPASRRCPRRSRRGSAAHPWRPAEDCADRDARARPDEQTQPQRQPGRRDGDDPAGHRGRVGGPRGAASAAAGAGRSAARPGRGAATWAAPRRAAPPPRSSPSMRSTARAPTAR